MRRIVLISVPGLLAAACVPPDAKDLPQPDPAIYQREAPPPKSDSNVYTFELIGKNSLGTAAIGVHPTAGPDAAPEGSMAGADGKSRAEAAATFFAENAVCQGTEFKLVPGETSQYDAAANTWTVFGRCVEA